MGWAFYVSIVLTLVSLAHLLTIHIAEPEPHAGGGRARPHVDVRGALESIRAVPGLMLLVLLAAFNNLLGGVFMALMDAYGLSVVSVQTWGFLFGIVSTAFIIGGLVVAKVGLGSRPARIVLAGNLVNWIVCATFTLRSSIVLLGAGLFVWLLLIPVIEAAEQTVLQRSIPFERQGRVFGFAQLIENAASPLTAILIGPVAERVFMPFMTDGRGARLDRRMVRHGPRAWHRPDLHARRPARHRRHRRRAPVRVVPAPRRRARRGLISRPARPPPRRARSRRRAGRGRSRSARRS